MWRVHWKGPPENVPPLSRNSCQSRDVVARSGEPELDQICRGCGAPDPFSCDYPPKDRRIPPGQHPYRIAISRPELEVAVHNRALTGDPLPLLVRQPHHVPLRHAATSVPGRPSCPTATVQVQRGAVLAVEPEILLPQLERLVRIGLPVD